MKRILWFRRDLRIEDNPLLSLGEEVLPIFIFDKNILESLPKEDKRLSFIFSQVKSLKSKLKLKGLDLKLFFARPIEVFSMLAKEGFDEVVASGDYQSYSIQRDLEISQILPFNYIHDTYIFEPEEVLKADGSPYLVFTPFYNKAKKTLTKDHLQEHPFVKHKLYTNDYENITHIHKGKSESLELSLRSLGFTQVPFNLQELPEKLALLKTKLKAYDKDRDFPSIQGTSDLSLELRFGTISIRSVLRLLAQENSKETEPFFRQLIFRDFYAYLLYHFPYIEKENYKYPFKGIEDVKKYKSFCEARTGVPIIDAGVNELIQTGRMHNRVRMICASFFTKDLLLPWQWGEAFFAQYLLDYDAASNILSWQWSAGTGIDPQPYFRIFNPYLQSKKFDKNGLYIKKWVPQLKKIDSKYFHDEKYLSEHHLSPYPYPIINHKSASTKALAYFKSLKGQ